MSSQPEAVRILSDSENAQRHRVALASLPALWRVTEHGQARVAYVDRLADWSRAVDVGADVIVVGDPASSTPADFAAAADKGRQVLAVADAATRLRADAQSSMRSSWTSVESRGIVSDPRDLVAMLFEQVTALRVVAGPITSCNLLVDTASSYVARVGTEMGVEAVLAATISTSRRRELTLDAVSLDRRLEVAVDLAPVARPAAVTSWTVDGAFRSVPIHQSGLRLAWARLAEGQEAWPTMAQVSDDVARCRAALGLLGSSH